MTIANKAALSGLVVLAGACFAILLTKAGAPHVLAAAVGGGMIGAVIGRLSRVDEKYRSIS